MTVTTSTARHLLLKFNDRERLPDALVAALQDEVVLAGWMRASGVVRDVSLRIGASGAPRALEGVAHVIALEGSIGLTGGDVSCGLRAVLARETESGVETFAGEIVEARIDVLEVHVTAFDDLNATRSLDATGQAWVLTATEGTGTPPAAPRSVETVSRGPAATATATAPAAATQGFGAAVRAAEAERAAPAIPAASPPQVLANAPPARPAAPKPSPTFSSMNQAMPQRIARPVQPETEDDPVPEAGDTVEHFAFGRCEVVKSDGDRLHLRLDKDQRIKEIALDVLKVTIVPTDDGTKSRHWKLARKF